MVNADQPAAGRYYSKTSRLKAMKIGDILMYNQYYTLCSSALFVYKK